jgi:hypothetical protein
MVGDVKGPDGAVSAGWNADPTGRHRARWHDGEGWTAQVSDGEGPLTDWQRLPPGRRRSLSSLLIALTPGIVLAILVVFAVKS